MFCTILPMYAVRGGLRRRALDDERLAVSDRQYLSRCCDLLEMELSALREYLDGLP